MTKKDDGRVSPWMLLPILFLYAILAYAADETVRPSSDTTAGESITVMDQDDSDATCSTVYCDTIDCSSYIDEDPDGTPDGNYIMHIEGSDQTMIFNMGDPTGTPSQAADAQEVRANFSECSFASCDQDGGTGEPNAYIDLYCDGNQQDTLLWTAVGDPEVDMVVSDTWTFDTTTYTDCDADGSNVQFALIMEHDGKSAGQRVGCWESVEWPVTWASEEGGRRVIVADNDSMHPNSRAAR